MIGIIGLGDLGTQIALQALSCGFEIMVFDINPTSQLTFNNGAIDKSHKIHLEHMKLARYAQDHNEVFGSCDIVHWAVPSREITNVTKVGKSLVLLHDSVMSSSEKSVAQRRDKDQFVFVHCLMNDAHKVKISQDCIAHGRALEHMRSLGLVPELISTKDHDMLMARTQGVFALLISKGIGKDLAKAHKNNDLTPSAEELLRAVAHRESQWTEATLESILSNPYLKSVEL